MHNCYGSHFYPQRCRTREQNDMHACWYQIQLRYATLTCWSPFKYNDQHVLVNEGIVHLDDVWVVKLLK